MDTPDIRFRESVRPSDAAAVERIVASTGFFRPDEIAVAVELVRERLDRGPDSGYHFVFAEQARAADEPRAHPEGNLGRVSPTSPPRACVLGYACFGPIPCTIDSYDLYWIAVGEAARGRGLGRRILLEAERRIAAMGGARVYIETSSRPLYDPTRGFYAAAGYREEARLADFYTAGDDKVIYVRRLPPPT